MYFPPHFFRQSFFKALIFTMVTLFIPTAITMLISGKIQKPIYAHEDSGKYVVLEENNIKETYDVEDFLVCAVMGQLSIDNPDALLQSFSVVLRTYIWKEIGEDNKIDVAKLKIPYITYNELEELWADDFAENYNHITKLIKETNLAVINHKGSLISPYYHSLSAGKTRLGSEALGEDMSYLPSVLCENDTSAKNYVQVYTYEYKDFAYKVRKINENICIDDASPMEAVQIVSRDSAGYILEMNIGNQRVDGTTFYEKMEINSPYFTIEDAGDCIRITTYGIGHGFGLSLSYAAVLADQGYNYIDILKYFYNDITV